MAVLFVSCGFAFGQGLNDGLVLWSLGVDDGTQDGNGDPADGLNDPASFNGTDFSVSGAAESISQNELPGNPANAGGISGAARDIDDDYYFAGVYNTVVDGSNYTPAGIVAVNESYYERALVSLDPNMRWHFNLPDTVTEGDNFVFTVDFLNLNEGIPEDVSSYDLTFLVNGTQIGDMQPHTDDNLAAAQSWDFTLDDFGGVEQVGEGFDHYVEIRSTPTGSARWASLDYVKLEVIRSDGDDDNDGLPDAWEETYSPGDLSKLSGLDNADFDNDGSTDLAEYIAGTDPTFDPGDPAPPLVQLGALYESPSGETIVIDAIPTAGFPAEFTYQWCFNGFKIPANLGGTASSINIDNLQANEGTWSVTVTNETGSVEQSFEYRIYADSDSDGLSDGYEEVISETDINNSDTDNDGLVDGDEVNTYSTNPNSSDSDSDGFTDLYELETAYDPNSAESTPDAQVNIMTAIEVDFNAALGATYEIQFSTDTIEWTVIEAGIVGEGNAVERLYSRKDFPIGFFRVERTDQ